MLGVRTTFNTTEVRGTAWDGRPKMVIVQYSKTEVGAWYPEYRGTRGIPWEYGGTTLQA